MEADDPAVVDDAVDDSGGHVPVAEHIGPSAEFEVGGEDQASFLVTVGYDLEEQAGAFDVDGQIVEFVDDDQFGLADRGEFPVEALFGVGVGPGWRR